jgi:hypothetical protein
MRLSSMVVLVALAACATKSVYRNVEGAPTTVYWQCKDNPSAGVPDRHGGGTHPCPTLVDVYCGAHREHYVVVVEVTHSWNGQLPSDPNAMCARIEQAQ